MEPLSVAARQAFVASGTIMVTCTWPIFASLDAGRACASAVAGPKKVFHPCGKPSSRAFGLPL